MCDQTPKVETDPTDPIADKLTKFCAEKLQKNEDPLTLRQQVGLEVEAFLYVFSDVHKEMTIQLEVNTKNLITLIAFEPRDDVIDRPTFKYLKCRAPLEAMPNGENEYLRLHLNPKKAGFTISGEREEETAVMKLDQQNFEVQIESVFQELEIIRMLALISPKAFKMLRDLHYPEIGNVNFPIPKLLEVLGLKSPLGTVFKNEIEAFLSDPENRTSLSLRLRELFSEDYPNNLDPEVMTSLFGYLYTGEPSSPLPNYDNTQIPPSRRAYGSLPVAL